MIMTLNDQNIVITNFYENLGSENKSMTATNSFEVSADTDFPDLSGIENLDVTSCTLTSNAGVNVPLQGTYTKVSNVNVSYDDRNHFYTANIVLM